MPEYRRRRVPGGTYFFTVALLRAAVRAVMLAQSFTIDAWVVFPEHLHCIWTLPAGDSDYSSRWRRIKALFSRAVPGVGDAAGLRAGERGVWQRRFWEHCIHDERDYAAHVDYVHWNPVRHGLVAAAGDWPYSSFRHWVARGHYPEDWLGRDAGIGAADERG